MDPAIGLGIGLHLVVASTPQSQPVDVLMSPAAVQAGVRVFASSFPTKMFLRIEYPEGTLYINSKTRTFVSHLGKTWSYSDVHCALNLPIAVSRRGVFIYCPGGNTIISYYNYLIDSGAGGFTGYPINFANGHLYILDAQGDWPILIDKVNTWNLYEPAYALTPPNFPDACLNPATEDPRRFVMKVSNINQKYFTMVSTQDCGYSMNISYNGQILFHEVKK